MATGQIRGKLRNGVTAFFLLLSVGAPASAASILVREELGFSFFPSQAWLLEEDGPAAIYDLSDFGPGVLFDLRYANDLFVMTALADNTVATGGSLPFGIDVYPGGVTPVTPAFLCDFVTPCYNGLGFFFSTSFPLAAGQSLSLPIPPPVAVDEPASWAAFATALLFVAWAMGRGRHRIGRPRALA